MVMSRRRANRVSREAQRINLADIGLVEDVQLCAAWAG